VRQVAASLVSFVGILFLCLGVAGLLTATALVPLLVAGYVLIGGGLLLARWAWRLYRGTPGAWRLTEGKSEAEARALARELAAAQWREAAAYLLVLAGIYLVIGLALEPSGLQAVPIALITAGGLAALAWASGRTRRG
jgi:hypothetical protein